MRFLQAPVLIVLIPFMGALAVALVGWGRRRLCSTLATLSAVGACAASVAGLWQTVTHQGTPIHYALGGWAAPLGIEWVIDPFNGSMAVMVSFMAIVVLFQSGPTVTKELSGKWTMYYATTLLLLTGLLGIVVTGDLFNLFVFLEVASLSVYALIAVGEDGAPMAAFRYLVLGTIGASFYLLGVGYLYAATGTLNMADMAQRLTPVLGSRPVMTGLIFITLGLLLKSGVFPLHGWLPDAYSYAPSATSSLMASIMTKVQAYALIRILLWVFGYHFLRHGVPIFETLLIVGAVSVVAGSLLAFAQSDLKRFLAYSSVSQIGLIFLAVGLGNRPGLVGAFLHIFNHALMKGCLFLVAGTLYHRYGHRNIFELGKMQGVGFWTKTALVAAALSMIGVPPFGGFFSKFYILLGALESQRIWVVIVVLGSSLLTAAYFFRLGEQVFFRPQGERVGKPLMPLEPMTWQLTFPLGILAFSILLLGVYADPLISKVLILAMPAGI